MVALVGATKTEKFSTIKTVANMKILDPDKAEELPNHERFPRPDSSRRSDFPWDRASRWIESHKGELMDDVFSKFNKLPWVPARHRTFHQFSKLLETRTFARGKEIFYYENYRWNIYNGLFESPISDLARYKHRRALYLHPVTKTIEVAKAKKVVDKPREVDCLHLGHYNQACKIEGIWYQAWIDEKDHSRAQKFYSSSQPLMTKLSSELAKNSFLYRLYPDLYYSPSIKVNYRQLSKSELRKLKINNESPTVLMEEDFNKRFAA